jgi:GMC oxidoreductase
VVTHPARVLRLTRRYARGGASDEPPASVWLETNAEQAPNPDSRVSPSRRYDRFGTPLPRIDWRLTDLDRRTIETFTGVVASELERLGLARVRPAEWLAASNGRWMSGIWEAYHHMGTTRMADDEKRGVVDQGCAVYGCRGLYIAGSSIFPTSGRANPTLTIVALSYAHHRCLFHSSCRPSQGDGAPLSVPGLSRAPARVAADVLLSPRHRRRSHPAARTSGSTATRSNVTPRATLRRSWEPRPRMLGSRRMRPASPRGSNGASTPRRRSPRTRRAPFSGARRSC